MISGVQGVMFFEHWLVYCIFCALVLQVLIQLECAPLLPY
jgi:hypothetical protein